jgi:hypothetical protein
MSSVTNIASAAPRPKGDTFETASRRHDGSTGQVNSYVREPVHAHLVQASADQAQEAAHVPLPPGSSRTRARRRAGSH